MFAAIDRMLRMAEPQARREKAMVAGRALERRDKHERGHMFTWRLRTGSKDAVLLTLRTGNLTTHIDSVLLTTTTSPHVWMAASEAEWILLSTASHHP